MSSEVQKAQDQLRLLASQSAYLGRSVQNLFATPLDKCLRHHVTAVAALRQMRQSAPSAVIRHMAVHPAEKVYMNPNAVPALLASEPTPQHLLNIAELKAEEEARQLQDSQTESQSQSEAGETNLSLEAKVVKYDHMIERLTEKRLRYERQLERKRKDTDTVERMQKKQRSEFSVNAMTYYDELHEVEKVKTEAPRRQSATTQVKQHLPVSYGGRSPEPEPDAASSQTRRRSSRLR